MCAASNKPYYDKGGPRMARRSLTITRLLYPVPRRCFHLGLTALAVGLIPLTAPAQFAGGGGSSSQPWQINLPVHMQTIGINPDYLDDHFILTADLDLSAYNGSSFNIIGTDAAPFVGSFDGEGHRIANFTYTSADHSNVGIFGYVDGAQITNLILESPHVDASNGDQIGPLVGNLNSGAVTNCAAVNAFVAGNVNVGGLVGTNKGTISQSSAQGQVAAAAAVGGLVGYNPTGSVIRSASFGSVSGDFAVGGLVGINEAGIENSFSRATASAPAGVAALAGINDGAISDSYAVGLVTGATDTGGLVAISLFGSVNDSFWDKNTTNQLGSAGGTGKYTFQMKMAATYTLVGWDLAGTWSICQITNYPRLVWQIPPADFLCPDAVDWIDFAFFAGWWGHDNCALTADCQGADLDLSGSVDLPDLARFMQLWLVEVLP